MHYALYMCIYPDKILHNTCNVATAVFDMTLTFLSGFDLSPIIHLSAILILLMHF